MQRAVMSRASSTLRAYVTLVAQEANMYPRNRSLRALCLTHADATRVLYAVRSLAHASGGAGSAGGGRRIGVGAGAAGWEEAGASGGGVGGGWEWHGEEEHRRELQELSALLDQVDAVLVAFVVRKMLEQAQLFLDMKSSNDWASASAKDLPNEYMQQLVSQLLTPALQTLRLGPAEGVGSVAGQVVGGVLEALLAHLLNIKARISRQGARRLQLDIDYLENWVQTSAAVPPCLRAPLLRLPVLARCRHVLALLLPPKLMSDEINSSPLPDKHAWIARRSRTKRGLFC